MAAPPNARVPPASFSPGPSPSADAAEQQRRRRLTARLQQAGAAPVPADHAFPVARAARGRGRQPLPPVHTHGSSPAVDVAFSPHAPLPPPARTSTRDTHLDEGQHSDSDSQENHNQHSQLNSTEQSAPHGKQQEERILPAGVKHERALRGKSLLDVVAYVQARGEALGFLYLQPCAPRGSVRRSAYDLRVVTHADIDETEFFTISAAGVTHVQGNLSTFTPLDRFVTELVLSAKLRAMPLFARFRQWKAFSRWRRAVTSARMAACAEKLGAQLFILSDILRPAELTVRNMCLDVVNMRLVSIEPDRTYTLREFLAAQDKQLEQLAKKLSGFRDEIMAVVRKACDAAFAARGYSVHIAPETYTEQARKRILCERLTNFVRLADLLVANAMQALCSESVAFLCSHLERLRADTIESGNVLYAKVQAALEELRANFEREASARRKKRVSMTGLEEPSMTTVPEGRDLLCLPSGEYVAMRKQAEPTVGGIRANLGDRSGATKAMPLFEIEQCFQEDDNALVFRPSQSDVLAALRQLIETFKGAVCGVGAMVTDESLAPMTNLAQLPARDDRDRERGESDKLQLASVLDEDEALRADTERLFELIKFAFGAAAAYGQRLAGLQQMHSDASSVDQGWLQATEHSLSFFSESLAKFEGMLEEGVAIVPLMQVGPMVVDCRALKEAFLPAPRDCMQVLQTVLPSIAARKTTNVMARMQDAVNQLEAKPATTQEFVENLDFIDGINNVMKAVENDAAEVAELYALVARFEIEVVPEDMAEFETAKANIVRLRDAAKAGTESMPRKVTEFTDELDKDISALGAEVLGVRDDAQKDIVFDPRAELDDVLRFTAELEERMQTLQKRAALYKSYQKRFNVEVTKFAALEETHTEVKAKCTLWNTVREWNDLEAGWGATPFHQLDAEQLSDTVNRMAKAAFSLNKTLPANDVTPELQLKITRMKEKLPVIMDLRNPALRKRHWERIDETVGETLPTDDTLTLDLLEKLDVWKHAALLQEISGGASSEASLEGMLKKVEDAWKEMEFPIVPYRDSKDVFILGGLDDIQVLLDDSQVNISTIAGSRHVGPIKQRVEDWQKQLALFASTLDEWTVCQRNWLYLESIFSAPDIQRQLPAEAKMFLEVDKSFKEAMRKTASFPNAIRAGCTPGFLAMFQKNNTLLEQIQKCLEDYLESKRMVFSRFFFLSNDELLEILSQTRNPHAVQPHMRKCFDAIQKLQFGEDGKSANDISGMISPEGEVVSLGKGLKARGNVEVWLCSVEDAMVKSLHGLTKVAIADYDTRPRTEWVGRHASQVIISVSQIMWSRDVTAAISGPDPQAALRSYEQQCIAQLAELAAISRSKIPKLFRSVLGALITIDVHARDNVTALVQAGVTQMEDFEWVRQLRYYWDDEIDDLVVRMSNSRYVYAYEYLGASMRLVITPLTDRCYLCLMGALQLNLGGAPAGPAGTGKTETTKDMAKAVGTQCVVFNCSEGLDFKMMGKFFSGLAQSGAWCCFDEFNRIDIEVLSVIAQQILTIKHAKDIGAARFMFEGREIRLIPKCAAFITMNPGYAGRTELPDNLKALFRPFAMMVPDYALIAEVILFSEGFEDPRSLARKMTQMYKLCSEQLSQQDHYDFGMRAVKSVLVMAGSLKRSRVGQSEATVLLTALRDSNLPKFLAEDVALFKAILSDLFPGVDLPEHDYGDLRRAVEACATQRGLQVIDAQIAKIIQFYETTVVRHGVMLVGPTGGGKTTVRQVLADTLTKLHADGADNADYKPVHAHVLNPKAVSMGELYGEINPTTTEWRDGLMATLVRQCVAETDDDHRWIVCDGPVDALWIENMNTVLDDNKMLCLANSERIKLSPYMHMLFEVQDLAVASPATVSRCGMVYVDPHELGWRPLVHTWAATLPACVPVSLRATLVELFESVVPPVLRAMSKNKLRECMAQVSVGKVASLCHLLQELMLGADAAIDWASVTAESTAMAQESNTADGGDAADVTTAAAREGPRLKAARAATLQQFAFALVWALGGGLIDADQLEFDAAVRDAFNEVRELRLPPSGTLFDYAVVTDADATAAARTEDDGAVAVVAMRAWTEQVPVFKYDPEVPFFDMLVPTSTTVKYGRLLELYSNGGHSVLFTGTTGVGKSVIAKDCLGQLEARGGVVPVTLNFSAQTNSRRTQEIIEGKLEKKRKNIIGAPAGKRIVIFVDDLNMPKLETYGASPPIELLRQFQDFGGFYDREKLFWTEIQDVTLMAACAPPGGGRNTVTPRLLRHFALFALPTPDVDTLKGIFTQIMTGFFTHGGFSKPVVRAAEGLIGSAVDIYARMSTDLLPTPAKSHYVFNLRDLSKCVQGMLQADPATVREQDHIFDLFCHECMRVFHDRLVNAEDKGYFRDILASVSGKHLNRNVDVADLASNPPLFGDFMKVGAAPEDRQYERLDSERLPKVLDDYLDDYNLSSSKEMKLVFFRDAIEHVARIARIIRQPRGNALLVGVGGTGKQSLTRIACHMAGYKCFQIEITRGYGYTEFREDLKRLYELAGSKGQNSVFLFTDTQIVREEFLEDINNMLNSGEVPNLFEPDELEKYIQPVRAAARAAGVPETRDAVFQYFINRVRDNLHIVLCMSPVGDAFRARCRMFPSIVNCCTIDWFTEWPREALLGVSRRFFEFVDLGDEALKGKVSEMCVEIHTSVSTMADRFYEELRRKYYTTPTSYLELINLYTSMLDVKRRELMLQRDRFQTGLNKLQETNEVVDAMQGELTALEPILREKAEATAKLMVKLQVDQTAADEVRAVVQSEEAIAKREAAETEAIKADAQRDLDMALPALEEATKALDKLDKKDVQELKVFNTPPPMVQVVLEAVCVLFGRKTDWKSAKMLLSEADFLKMMITFDKDNIADRTLKKLKPYVDNPDFVPEKVDKVSRACTSMCMWVRAMELYARVYRTVEPKREKLAGAQTALAKTMAELHEKQGRLKEVEDKIAELQKMYRESVAAKEELEHKQQQTAGRLKRAGKLTAALGDEQVRWGETVRSYDEQVNDVAGNVFLAAACVAYFGAFTSSYRQELVEGWMAKCRELAIPVTDGMGVADVLSSPYQIRQWNAVGLPRDRLSTENAVLVTCGRRWPLMIDPQDQANNWVRQMEAKNGLQIIKLTEPNFLRTLENAIRTGQPVLLEEVGESLDPSLEPVLLKQTFKQGGRTLIRLGDSDVDYDKNFRFYMTTKLANPHYLPEICIKVTIINFTVTEAGLEDQLLADVVRLERPDLEEQRSKLIVQINGDREQLKAIEDEILRMLFNSEGNILDNEQLINALNDSKVTSTAIASRLQQAETTEASITEARERYRPAALRGSLLFFSIATMGGIDPMYQNSLAYFKQLFVACISASEKHAELERRLQSIIDYATLNIYTNIARGLFERHKLMFSFSLCISILRQRGELSAAEWSYFLRGAGADERERPPLPESAGAWLGTELWHDACDLQAAFGEAFAGLTDALAAGAVSVTVGTLTVTIGPPEVTASGGDGNTWGAGLTSFQALMLVRALTLDRLVEATAAFVSKSLGAAFVESPAVEMATLFKDMAAAVPLIFVLSVGSDPMSGFMRFAGEREYTDRVHAISLGQGQGPVAERLIDRAAKAGDWVFLQNCHLAESWMLRMEMVIKGLGDPKAAVHPDFRLFLSSAPCKFFPVSVLQNSVKVTNEPPKGLRANMRRAFAGVPAEFFEQHRLGQDWRKLIFGLCFFHAIIQERKKFGALGWNIPYEFNGSDRECALENLRIFLADGHVPWNALFFITSAITYGGRVTDRWDERCLATVLKRFFTPSALEPSFTYSESGTYYAPAVDTLTEVQAYIDSLPFADHPEVFGMHDNANIAYQRDDANTLIRHILDVQPRLAASGGARTPDEIVADLATQIQERLPTELLSLDDAVEGTFDLDAQGRVQSLSTVLRQEVDRFNSLLLVLWPTLDNIKKALKGLVVMSDELERVYTSFINNQVPAVWEAAAYPSLKPLGSWVKDLVQRLAFIDSWLRRGSPRSFWLAGFFFPQGFLTGTLQTFARKYNVPIDTLSFRFSVLAGQYIEEGTEGAAAAIAALTAPADGVLVHGVFMDACRWDDDAGQIADSHLGQMHGTLPVMHMLPAADFSPPPEDYVAPLYKTSARAGVLSTTGHSTNFVVAAHLPSAQPQDYWIAKGAALLCQAE